MEHAVSLTDYKEYIVNMHLYYSTVLKQLLKDAKDSPAESKVITIKNFLKFDKPKQEPTLDSDRLQRLQQVELIVQAMAMEYNRVMYYEHYDNTYLSISDAFANEFFTYMLHKRQRDVTLH